MSKESREATMIPKPPLESILGLILGLILEVILEVILKVILEVILVNEVIEVLEELKELTPGLTLSPLSSSRFPGLISRP